MARRLALFFLILLAFTSRAGFCQPPPTEESPPDSLFTISVPPPQNLRVADAPNDNGTALSITWDLLKGDFGSPVTGYNIFREGPSGEPELITTIPQGTTDYRASGLRKGKPSRFAIGAVLLDGTIGELSPLVEGTPRAQWFHSAKGFLLINLIVVSAAILISVMMAARGKIFKIRKIAGIEAVEESVGRATEMGKSILFIPGIQDMDNVQTVAGMTILGSIAQMAAHYETTIDVPVSKSLVMSTGREVVKEAYTTAGRPDLFNENIVHYVTDEQFGYVAAIDGVMLRDRPATCIYMGAFFAESLILAETGNSIGAIQIAGTAMPTQLPFFVAACDYTLIGEELFAASPYLSKSPSLLGCLRGQGVGNALRALCASLRSSQPSDDGAS